MRKIGITTTIPSEIIYSAGAIPVDLNNIFITSPVPNDFVYSAEKEGFPATLCSWVKGIYSSAKSRDDLKEIVVVTDGDCSNSRPLAELLERIGKKVITFGYPFDRNRKKLEEHIFELLKYFNVTLEEASKTAQKLDKIREKLDYLDFMSWHDGKITGLENHIWLVNSSDFEGNPKDYENRLDDFLRIAEKRKAKNDFLRIGLVGVPPIFSDLYEYLESKGARVIYNETQRQFSFPLTNRVGDFVDRYLNYAYPYSFTFRLQDIKKQIEIRHLDGIIHYTQSFCHHQMEHVLLKNSVNVPTLFLEGDRPTKLDERLKIRIESFIEMIG